MGFLIYGYARCSTNEDRQDINRQIKELVDMGINRQNIFLEYESGSKLDRIELNRLFSYIEVGDTIVSTEVSRLTRSNQQLCKILNIIKEKKLKLILGTFVVDCSSGELDPMTEGILKMMTVFAELEKNMIVNRIRSGLKNAKNKGKKLGRPKITLETLPKKFLKHYPKYKKKELKITDLSKLCGCSRPTIYKYIYLIENK